MYGCCPSGSVCNPVGGCDWPETNTSSISSSVPEVTFVTTYVVTSYVTSIISEACGPGNSSSLGSGGGGGITFTEPDGVTVISKSGVIIIGSDTFTAPTGLTTPKTITTDGETFTFYPSSGTGSISSGTNKISSRSRSGSSSPGVITETLPDGVTVISSSGVIIIGSDTITVPTGLTAPETITTDGETFTFTPSSTPTSTNSSGGGVGGLPTYTAWPSGAHITPLATPVPSPEVVKGHGAIPCSAWFLAVSGNN